MSVKNLNTTLSSRALGPKYSSLGTSVTATPFSHFSIFHGPPDQV